MVRTKSEIDGAHLIEASQQKARCRQQHESNCEFRGDKGGAQVGMATAGRPGATAFFESFVHAGARCSERWDQTAEQTCEHGQSERKCDNLPIETDGANAWQGLRKEADADSQ